MPALDVLSRVRREKRTILTEVESMELLRQAGLTVVDSRLARIKKDAIQLSRELGFPVALKIVSPDIVHRSEVGGIKLGIRNEAQLQKAFDEIMEAVRVKHPRARIQGVSVQHMVPRGLEAIVGMSKDPQLGPVLMFGLGGVLVEVLKDVSFRLVPVSKSDASQMLREIKGYPLIQGYRDSKPVSILALEDTLLKVSKFVEKTAAIRTLEINPLFAYRERAVAVDARITIESQGKS